MRHLLPILSATLLLAACTSAEKSQFASIDTDGWHYGDTLYLAPKLYESADSLPTVYGDLSIVVRHTNAYEYSNLWLSVNYADSDTIHTDTINVILADDYGNWLGNGMGMSFQLCQNAVDHVRLDLTQPIKVSHIMRTDTLTGIEQIGVVYVQGADK